MSGTRQLIANTHWAAPVLRNGLGEYPAALAAARQAVASGEPFLAGFLPARAGGGGRRVRRARRRRRGPGIAADRAHRRPGAGSNLGIAAYARGLVTGVEDHCREAGWHAHQRNIFRRLGITSRRQLRDHPGLGV
ncbi:hypothetical protein [Streptomyces dioscori]|uniref:hypothetical protein n=1 Tax=Streptomyces dioscori TaxID=2109333 RepID=UPI001CEDFE2E|nr:hypothetical protein [Streptomyces dioscori]